LRTVVGRVWRALAGRSWYAVINVFIDSIVWNFIFDGVPGPICDAYRQGDMVVFLTDFGKSGLPSRQSFALERTPINRYHIRRPRSNLRIPQV